MATQVRPTPARPEKGLGDLHRESDKVRVCGFHYGQRSNTWSHSGPNIWLLIFLYCWWRGLQNI